MHKLDVFVDTFAKRIAFLCVIVVLTGAPLWIGQIHVGNLLTSMKSTADLFRLTEGTIAQQMFATRFLFDMLAGSLKINGILTALISSLRLSEVLWLIGVMLLASIHALDTSLKTLRWAFLSVFGIQGFVYVGAGFVLYSAYYAGSGANAAVLLSQLGLFLRIVTWVEVVLSVFATFIALFRVYREEMD